MCLLGYPTRVGANDRQLAKAGMTGDVRPPMKGGMKVRIIVPTLKSADFLSEGGSGQKEKSLLWKLDSPY